MPDQNGADINRHYQDAQQAQLGERVTNLGRRQSDLEAEMRSGFRAMEQSITAFTNETRTSIAALSTSLAERAKPQWQALSVMLAFAAILGGLAYMPIREATTDLKGAVASLAANTVTHQEMDWRTARSAEDRARQEAAVADLRSGAVTRNEWTERNRAYEQQATELGRRLDEMRSDFGSVYGQRDVIQDMKKEIDTLRQRLAGMRETVPPG